MNHLENAIRLLKAAHDAGDLNGPAMEAYLSLRKIRAWPEKRDALRAIVGTPAEELGLEGTFTQAARECDLIVEKTYDLLTHHHHPYKIDSEREASLHGAAQAGEPLYI